MQKKKLQKNQPLDNFLEIPKFLEETIQVLFVQPFLATEKFHDTTPRRWLELSRPRYTKALATVSGSPPAAMLRCIAWQKWEFRTVVQG